MSSPTVARATVVVVAFLAVFLMVWTTAAAFRGHREIPVDVGDCAVVLVRDASQVCR